MNDPAGRGSRGVLVALCVAGGAAITIAAVILLRSLDPEALPWLRLSAVAAAVLLLILFRRSAWGLWIYFLGVPPIVPPEAPSHPFGTARGRSKHVTCPGCRGLVSRETLGPDGALHCPACHTAVQVLRPA